jgi:uncharacterized protein (DUF302 family)
MKGKTGFEVRISQDYDTAIEMVTEVLKAEGFGILTRIDVKETLKKKIDVDFRPYAILGACNPPLAHQALESDAKVGLMLPCNVTVEAAEGGGSIVRFANPGLMVQFVEEPDLPGLQAAADGATARIKRAAQALEAN